MNLSLFLLGQPNEYRYCLTTLWMTEESNQCSIPGQSWFLSLLQFPEWLWVPHSLPCNGYRRLFPQKQSNRRGCLSLGAAKPAIKNKWPCTSTTLYVVPGVVFHALNALKFTLTATAATTTTTTTTTITTAAAPPPPPLPPPTTFSPPPPQ